jgi:hypothetical protein
MDMKDVWVHCGNWRLKALLYYEDQRVHIEAKGFEKRNIWKYLEIIHYEFALDCSITITNFSTSADTVFPTT